MPLPDLPPRIRTSDPASFAQKTFTERLPKILGTILEQNPYPARVQEQVRALAAEFEQSRPVKALGGRQPESRLWNSFLAEQPNQGWLDLPYYFAETFFYRRLLEATGYFDPGEGQGRDPFQRAKHAQLTKDIRPFEDALQGLSAQGLEGQCETLLTCCLWGNQVDLSNFSGNFENHLSQGTSAGRLLINQARAISQLLSRGGWRLAYVLDNVGIELYFDLRLVDFLLEQGWAEKVTLHLKNCPFFLSDAMPKDLQAALRVLREAGSPASRQLARRIEAALSSGRMVAGSDPFWTSAATFLDAPGELRRVLDDSSLAIFKGDLNYRRLLGDRHWDATTRTEDILGYFTISVAILRTLKCELATGLSARQVERLNAEDPHWLTNGEHGILQLIEK